MSTTIIPQSTRIVLRPDNVEFYDNWMTLIQKVNQVNVTDLLSNYQIFLDTDLVIDTIQMKKHYIDIRVGVRPTNTVIRLTGQFLFHVTGKHDITDVTFNPAHYPTTV